MPHWQPRLGLLPPPPHLPLANGESVCGPSVFVLLSAEAINRGVTRAAAEEVQKHRCGCWAAGKQILSTGLYGDLQTPLSGLQLHNLFRQLKAVGIFSTCNTQYVAAVGGLVAVIPHGGQLAFNLFDALVQLICAAVACVFSRLQLADALIQSLNRVEKVLDVDGDVLESLCGEITKLIQGGVCVRI